MKLEHVSVSFPVKKDFPFQKKRFVKAVTDVSVEIYAGETFGVVGESGCGKSTLANTTLGMAAGGRRQDLFRRRRDDRDEQKQLKEVRRSLQMIFQDPFSSLNPRFSVFDIISEPRASRGDTPANRCGRKSPPCSAKWGFPRRIWIGTLRIFPAGRNSASASPARSS